MSKTMLLLATFLLASIQVARSETSVPSPANCECKTCLLENGICIVTHTPGPRDPVKDGKYPGQAETRFAPYNSGNSGRVSKEH